MQAGIYCSWGWSVDASRFECSHGGKVRSNWPTDSDFRVDSCRFPYVQRRRGSRPQRILVVEDSTDMRELWRMWFTGLGFTVIEAGNGVEALEQVNNAEPDLVLLDVAMPIMDGLEALELIRGQKQTANLPVIVLSAQDGRVAQRARALGSDVFLTKPVWPDDLMVHVRALLPCP